MSSVYSAASHDVLIVGQRDTLMGVTVRNLAMPYKDLHYERIESRLYKKLNKEVQ